VGIVPVPVGFDMDREPRTMDQHCQRMAAAWAKTYDAGEDRWSHTAASRWTSAVVIASLNPVSRVLDVGTGRGIDAVRYAAEGHTVTGIDLVALPEWVGIESRWPSVRFEQGALLDHVTCEPYDVIVDAGCFHHQHPADLDRHLAHIRRLLRPGGTLWLATLTPREAHDTHAPHLAQPQTDGSFTLAFTEVEIRERLARTGFKVVNAKVQPRHRLNGLDDLLLRVTPR